ncbi:hypothetical protein SCLCIDRAFT_397644 [Scleroderma citrinum Foug A]|uniref:Uncharacterized protein n=1 Tax=Scleroderma citrinum Foug A TaxID=1036808 RepID=A0A0C3EDQ6_9AGAM|nr:hypothetical protein SCLCIDRAFT_397644 [Scleroderma citrinum Foug A]
MSQSIPSNSMFQCTRSRTKNATCHLRRRTRPRPRPLCLRRQRSHCHSAIYVDGPDQHTTLTTCIDDTATSHHPAICGKCDHHHLDDDDDQHRLR